MKKIIAILSVFIMFTINIANVINYKTSSIEETDKKLVQQNIEPDSENFDDLNINDVINIINVGFGNCTIEFWFASMSMKKKLKISYNAWTKYFSPMMEKLDKYIAKFLLSVTSAGQIKVALINMFSQVIKYNFWKGGNDADRNAPYWDGYQLAASYIIKNKEYLDTFFRSNGPDSFFVTEYWRNYYFLDKEQLEALEIDSVEKVFISDIEKFTVPSWFPVLKAEIWDIEQYVFHSEGTSIVQSEISDKLTVEFKFSDETIKNLQKILNKYSAIDKIPFYSGDVALAFCVLLKEKILNDFPDLNETVAMQFATYIYKYRDEVNTWSAFKTAYIEADFYWFEDAMEVAYENAGKSFDRFKILREWPL